MHRALRKGPLFTKNFFHFLQNTPAFSTFFTTPSISFPAYGPGIHSNMPYWFAARRGYARGRTARLSWARSRTIFLIQRSRTDLAWIGTAHSSLVDTARLICRAGSVQRSGVRPSVCPIDRQLQTLELRRRNHPMWPVGRVPSNFGDHKDQVYLVPSNFCNWLSFFFAGQPNRFPPPQTS